MIYLTLINTYIMKYYLFISFFTLSILYACKEKISEPCPEEFLVYGEVKPYADTYNVGDTISLSVTFSKHIFEKRTEKYFDLIDLKIESEFYIFKIDTINDGTDFGVFQYVDLISSDKYQEYVQDFGGGGQMYFSNIIFKNDTFYHELKFIPEIKGIFILTYGPFTMDNNMNFDGKCSNRDFNLNTRLNSDKDNNIYLLNQSPDVHFNTWILQNPELRFYPSRFAYKVE